MIFLFNLKKNNNNIMITITKRGQVFLDKKIICNRPGITAEAIYDCETKIGVSKNIKNPYTISLATQGTLLSFFSVNKKGLSKEDLDAAWFIDYQRAYFLSTLNDLNGHLSKWSNDNTFGDILLNMTIDDSFISLDSDYSWTFLIEPNYKRLVLVCLWDIECQEFIPPSSPLWKSPKFCELPVFLKNENGIVSSLKEEQKSQPLTEHDVPLTYGKPLLVTIYCGEEIFTIRAMTHNDMIVNKMRNRSIDKFVALLVARFKEEDTTIFENRYFTFGEITRFNSMLRRGILQFKTEIFQKAEMKKWICFPDKIYNIIRLGDILDENISCREKQNKALIELKKCTKGWKIKALYQFYKVYMCT
jgi:hypothetical protein